MLEGKGSFQDQKVKVDINHFDTIKNYELGYELNKYY